jgi:hypothetical protein
MARTPSAISRPGLRSYQAGAAASAAAGIAAAWMISAGEMLEATYSSSSNTPMTGNSDARVTIPNPERPEPPLPAAAAMPMPSDSTSGTVTGPVVTAPVSHARPSALTSSGSLAAYRLKPSTGISVA